MSKQTSIDAIVNLSLCLVIVFMVLYALVYCWELLHHTCDCMETDFIWWFPIQMVLVLLPFIMFVIYWFDIVISMLLPCVSQMCVCVEECIAMVILCLSTILFMVPSVWTIIGTVLLFTDASCLKETSMFLFVSSIVWLIISYIVSIILIPFSCVFCFANCIMGMCILEGGDEGTIGRGFGKYKRKRKRKYSSKVNKQKVTIDV